ncbi:MAG: LytTR family transcriptional regulator [Cryomorphaceae bacterium]|nr:LytTR family transcriptional regulator [Cryomorphaceae bacterium]
MSKNSSTNLYLPSFHTFNDSQYATLKIHKKRTSLTILKLKYPTYNSPKEIGTSALIVALLVYLFLVLFQPFGTYNYIHANKYLLLAPYAIIAFVAFYMGDYFIAKRFEKWTWMNEICKNCILLLLCSIVSYWYNMYFINNADFSLRTLFYMVLFTYAVGLPICTIAFFGKPFFLKLNENQSEVLQANSKIKTERRISITPSFGDEISLLEKHFLYAQSEGNYSNIFFLKNGEVASKLLRISLKKLEEQICNDEIIRCHRSYILNIQNAIKKKGNAQGFIVTLHHTTHKIPISRKYIDRIQSVSK